MYHRELVHNNKNRIQSCHGRKFCVGPRGRGDSLRPHQRGDNKEGGWLRKPIRGTRWFIVRSCAFHPHFGRVGKAMRELSRSQLSISTSRVSMSRRGEGKHHEDTARMQTRSRPPSVSADEFGQSFPSSKEVKEQKTIRPGTRPVPKEAPILLKGKLRLYIDSHGHNRYLMSFDPAHYFADRKSTVQNSVPKSK